MASSENLMAFDPWALRSAGFGDPWLADVFSRETETLTKVLQKSLSEKPAAAGGLGFSGVETVLPVFKPEETPVGTPSASGPTVSNGSENETAGTKRRNGGGVGPDGKIIKKRKPRASKRATTTYITADPAHFRQMVQQVTGFQFGGAFQQIPPAAPVVKPEPHRAVHRLHNPAGWCLPTLDTSAFLLDQNKQAVDPTNSYATQLHPISAPPPKTEADGGCASEFDYELFSSFPTLESWKTVV